jgi:hypothetical protein
VVHLAADVAPFIQRRELLAYEQRLARLAYAYGVDLRRSAWLDASTLGEPILRTVDRRWNALVADLGGSILQDANKSAPVEVMEEIARLVRLLRAPLPTLRLLARGTKSDAWPIITPLGATKGAVHWLVLDVERLLACPAHERTFLLATALGHLQCDHGPMFTAHLMAYRAERGLGLVRALLKPWSRVGWFSGDRAGLIALGELEPTLAALRVHADAGVEWMPRPVDLVMREQALQDFDRAAVMVRVRISQSRDTGFTLAPPRPTKSDDGEGEGEGDDDDDESGAKANGAKAAPSADTSARDQGDDRDPYRNAAPEGSAADPDAELAQALASAWSLARCDQRLTRRLGLL